MNPTELIVRHSFAPNRLRYCGAMDLSPIISGFIKKNSQALEKKLQSGLHSFKGLFSYLSLIASENDCEPFDARVGEAYWIGNELLENVSTESIQRLFLEQFSKPDFLGEELARELAARIPLGALAHHSFHVFFTHFMACAVPATIQNLNRCRIAPACVLESSGSELVVELEPIEFENQQLVFGKKRVQTVEKPFSDSIQTGSFVSVHWDTYCMTLSSEQKKALDYFTKRNLDAINSSKPFQNLD